MFIQKKAWRACLALSVCSVLALMCWISRIRSGKSRLTRGAGFVSPRYGRELVFFDLESVLVLTGAMVPNCESYRVSE